MTLPEGKMSRSDFLVCWALIFIGCATGSGAMRELPSATHHDVAVQISALPSGQTAWQPLWPADTLHSGDQISLRVAARQPLYVYVARTASGGTLQSVYSNDARDQATPEAALTIPTAGGDITLSKEVGQEDLRIIASTQPLSSAEFLKRATAVATRGTREPPPIATDGNRGPYTTYGLLDAAGVAVLRFQFWHR
jgi:hypothetical protein